MDSKRSNSQPRNARGRYESNDWAALCVCGHTLGVHTAAGSHECLECDGAYLCDGFARAKEDR